MDTEHVLERALHGIGQIGNGCLDRLLLPLDALDHSVRGLGTTLGEPSGDVLPSLISVLLVLLPGSDVRLALSTAGLEEAVRHRRTLIDPSLGNLLDDRAGDAHLGQLLELACEGLHGTDVHLHGLRCLPQIGGGGPLAVGPALAGHPHVQAAVAEEATGHRRLDAVQLIGLFLCSFEPGVQLLRLGVEAAQTGLELPCLGGGLGTRTPREVLVLAQTEQIVDHAVTSGEATRDRVPDVAAAEVGTGVAAQLVDALPALPFLLGPVSGQLGSTLFSFLPFLCRLEAFLGRLQLVLGNANPALGLALCFLGLGIILLTPGCAELVIGCVHSGLCGGDSAPRHGH